MSSAIQSLKKRYEQKLQDAGGDDGLVFVDDTWLLDEEGAPLKIYVKPALTIARSKEATALANAGKATEAMVSTIIGNARDKNGQLLFKKADRIELENYGELQDLIEVVGKMNEVWGYGGNGEPDLEEMEKNS